MQFDQFGLIDPLLRAVRDEGYTTATPIQSKAIPPVLTGVDLLGCAQTGTGKTASFALPILQRLTQQQARRGNRPVRCLVLAPTRELAAQVGDSFRSYGRHLTLRIAVIFGGVGQGAQVESLRRGVDILVACPGRLLDLMQQGHARLDAVEILVLDEADRMLDMGFLPDIRKVLHVIPKDRQTLLFSATMPKEIRALANGIMRNPQEISVAPVSSTAETVAQCVYMVPKPNKQGLLNHLLNDPAVVRALVFSRTKHGADKVVKQLARVSIPAEAIHGNKSQNARIRAIDNFRSGATRVLVASDIAARGLDIDGITHVINFDLPNEPETYVHRIGRTGRAGASGIAISFCDGEERPWLVDIERTIRRKVPVAPVPNFPPAPAPIFEPRDHDFNRSRGGRGGGGNRPQRSGGTTNGGGHARREGHGGPGFRSR